jgi:hypothetical protein
MLKICLKLIDQYGVQSYFYIRSLIYYDYNINNLKVHKIFLFSINLKMKKKNKLSTCNPFCKTKNLVASKCI